MTFANRKFLTFLGTATVVIVAEYVMVLSDCVISGRVLGEHALGAVNLLMPAFLGVSFFTWLLAEGTATVYSDAIARMRKERAAELAGQGLVAALVLGGILGAFAALLENPYLAFMEADADTTALAGGYWKWYPAVIVLESIDLLLLYLVYADGGKWSCLLSYCSQVVFNVALSYGFCRGAWRLPALGMGGISLGTACAYLVGIAALLPRLLDRAVCGVRFKPTFRPSDLLRAFRLGFGDASAGLFQALLFLVVAKYTINHWGASALPIATAVFCILRLTVFFNGIGIALQPLETVYYGEGNTTGVKHLVRFAAFVSLAEGLLFSAVVLAVSRWIVSSMGITNPPLVDGARHAVGLTALGLAGYAITYMLNSHYQFTGRSGRSIALTALAFFVMPAALLFILGRVVGMEGVWIALATGPAFAIGSILPFQHRCREEDVAPLMWSLVPSDLTECARVAAKAGKMLSHKLPETTVKQITDMIGLAMRLIRVENDGQRRVQAEISVMCEEKSARLVVRDDGRHFAMTEQGGPSLHLPAAGFNRNLFMFAVREETDDRRYEVVRGADVTLKAIEDVVALDNQNYEEECYHKTAGYNYALFRTNDESGIAVRDRETGSIVGYAMLLPISAETYARIRTGCFIDSDLTPEMVVRYGVPGIYHLYFASVVVHPEHRSARMILTMMDAIAEVFLELAKRGIFINRMLADCVSRDGVKFCRLFGLNKICTSNHKSDIYEVFCLPPMFRESTPTIQRLAKIYREKYAFFVKGTSRSDAT